MVFASIVEYAAVSYIGNLRPPKKKSDARMKPVPMASKSQMKNAGAVMACRRASCHCIHHQMAMQQINGDSAPTLRPALVIANNNMLNVAIEKPQRAAAATSGAEATAAATRMPTVSTQSCDDLWQTATTMVKRINVLLISLAWVD